MAFMKYWKYRKKLTITPGTGVPTDSYQFGPLTVYYGSGSDSGLSVYLAGKCEADFDDVRFTASDGTTLLSYWLKSKTDGNNAVFWVKIPSNLNNVAEIYIYYGGPYGIGSLSNQAATFVDVIANVVGAWNMEEPEAEVSPLAYFEDQDAATFWGDIGTGKAVSNEATIKISGTQSTKITSTAVSQLGHWTVTETNCSAKNRVTFWFYGANTGAAWQFRIYCTGGGYANYQVTDNFAGWRLFTIPYTTFTISGSMNWAQVTSLYLVSVPIGVFYIDHVLFDTSPAVVDSSGYGNNGVSTGTTIEDGPFAGKKARRFNGIGDLVTIADAAVLDGFAKYTAFAYVKLTTGSKYQQIYSKQGADSYSGAHSMRVQDNNMHYGVASIGGSTKYATSVAGFTIGTWNKAAIIYDGTYLYSYLNAAVTMGQAASGSVEASAKALLFGRREDAGSPLWMDGLIASFVLFNNNLNTVQLNNMSANYPDVTLEAGKVLVRKYASTTQPSAGAWTTQETAAAILGGFAVNIVDESFSGDRETINKEWDSWVGQLGHQRKNRTYGVYAKHEFTIWEDADEVPYVNSVWTPFSTDQRLGTEIAFTINNARVAVYVGNFVILRLKIRYSQNLKVRFIDVSIREV